jgi:hypothetical protein
MLSLKKKKKTPTPNHNHQFPTPFRPKVVIKEGLGMKAQLVEHWVQSPESNLSTTRKKKLKRHINI